MTQPGSAADGEIIAGLDGLYSAVVCDVLDRLGRRNQVLPPAIRPLTPVTRVCGRIFPARAEPVQCAPVSPYEREIAVVEAMSAGDVLLMEAGHNQSCGLWGELLTTACMAKQVRGVVMTACTRDHWKIKDCSFPVFGIGYHPADSLGRLDVLSIGEPVWIGGVEARRGDYVLGDQDGVVVVPMELAAETLRLALEKANGEDRVRAELSRGVPMGEVFRRYGIL